MNERDIFIEALQKTDTAARQAYLHQACGGDDALRQRVEELLKMLEQAGSFLEAPPAVPGTTDAPEAQPDAEEAGSRIGPYKLVQKLGEGGMGTVWVAEQQEPVKRRVALKLIKAGMDSGHVLRRFEQERQALALMDHPHIAKVLDAGSTSGRPYFVMELVKGVPITKYCDELHLTLPERLELFVPVCQAIQHAHQKGIVHRDIKPSNVLVCIQDGKPAPKVIDFGVAKALHQQLTEQSLYTEIGQVIGTLEYMSPEQAELSALDIDTRADVYALGVLLYELLTGSTPLRRKRLKDAAVLELLRRIREEEPPKPSTRLSESKESLASMAALRRTEPGRLAKAVRGELDWIVMKALEKDRTRRYETAIGLARDIERHLHDEPVEACPPSAGYRLRKFARRYRTVLATAATFAALLLIAAGVSIWLALAARRAESIANDKREEAEEAQQKEAHERNRADRESSQAKANAVETGRALDRMSVAKGIQLAEKGDLFHALSWFVKPLERGGLTPEEERVHRTRIACYLRHTPGRPVLRQMFFTDGPVSHAAWSADAKRVLTVSGKIVRIWDVRSGESLAALAHPVDVAAAQFTPDGSRVLTVCDRAVWQWDVRSGRQLGPPLVDWGGVLQNPLSVLPRTPLQFVGNNGAQKLANAGWNGSESVEISRDGRRVLFSFKRVLSLWDRETHKLIGQWLRGAKRVVSDHALSPDGQRLLLIRDDLTTVYDTTIGKAVSRVIEHGSPVDSATFSRDGTRALTIGEDGVAQVWDATTWRVLTRINNPDAESRRFAQFSPDNRFVAFGGYFWEMTPYLVWWDVESGRQVRVFDDREHDIRALDWRPDSQQLLWGFRRGDVTLWDVSPAHAPDASLPPCGPVTATYGPDGRSLLTIAGDGEVRIWDLGGGNGPFTLKPPGKDVFSTNIRLVMISEGRVHSHWNYDLAMFIEPANHPTGVEETAWRLAWEKIKNLLPPEAAFQSGALSPDQSRVLTSHVEPHKSVAKKLQLWDARTRNRVGKPLQTPRYFNCAAFSADSQLFVAGSEDGAVLLVDARTGEPIGNPLQHGGPVLYADFSPDSKILVTCGSNKAARLWHTRTGQPIGDKLLHEDDVTVAAFSANGQMIATASLDGSVRLWDARGTSLGMLRCKSGYARSLLFHPSGLLLIAFPDDMIRLWDVALQQEVSPRMEGRYNMMGFSFGPRPRRDSLRTAGGTVLNPGFDLPSDDRPSSDLIKLAQLYSGKRLGATGGTIALSKQDLQVLWRDLRTKYPEEFSVSSKVAVEWRISQLQSASVRVERPTSVAFHRRWLADELTEASWQPGERGNEDMMRVDYLQRLLALAQHSRHAAATDAADALAARWHKDHDTLYNCACVHALAAGAVKGDAALAERYAARAIALLRQAIEAGYKDSEKLRKDADLDTLRRREGFRELLKKLDANKP